MQKRTLLDIVQDILSSMDGDEVNSIFDTTESEQVARVVRETYDYIVTNLDLPESYGPFELEATSSATPVLMMIPSIGDTIKWLKYDVSNSGETKNFKTLQFVPFRDFIEIVNNVPAEGGDNIETFQLSLNNGLFDVYFKNDEAPSMYSTVDDTRILFNAYDSTQGSSLIKGRTMAFGKIIPTFVMEDDFIPPLDANQFVYLFNEAKAQAYNDLQQMDNARADKRSRDMKTKSQFNKMNIGGYTYQTRTDLPNFGRRSR